MNNFFERLLGRRNQSSGSTAKQRLQLVLVTDRSDLSPEKLKAMKDEIIAVISKYVNVASDKVEINVEQRQRDNWLVADIPLVKGELIISDNGVEDA
ncbi:MAG TPA: cell division topological specificity factor MinE [Aggregatilineales bacterium]|nr:cell division topological specificity factor MinE [Aggregatilineales bacterium]